MWSLELSHLTPGTRRQGFPTWSWLSIRARISNRNGELMRPLSAGSVKNSIIDGTAQIETRDGAAIYQWTEFATSELIMSAGSNVLAIHLEGWCFRVGPFSLANIDNQGMFCHKVDSPAGVLEFFPDPWAEQVRNMTCVAP